MKCWCQTTRRHIPEVSKFQSRHEEVGHQILKIFLVGLGRNMWYWVVSSLCWNTIRRALCYTGTHDGWRNL